MPIGSKERWLDEGLAVLGEVGIKGVTIDALRARLGLTTGSFYHHFGGMDGYRSALLAYYEERDTQAYIDMIEALPADDGASKLRALMTAAVDAIEADEALEPQVRVWASHDDAARACLERVDAQRSEYIRRQCRATGAEPELADEIGAMIYLIAIGADHIVPRIPARQQARMWDRLIRDLEASAAIGSGHEESRRNRSEA